MYNDFNYTSLGKVAEGILTKCGRVGPAKMEQLKQTIADVERERNAFKEGVEPL